MSSTPSDTNRLRILLSDDEVEELEQLLLSDIMSDQTMTLDILDGYLTAIVIGPTAIELGRWLPGVWGDTEDDAPKFESAEQAAHATELLQRHMNGIVWSMQDDPDSFEPVLYEQTYGRGSRSYLDGEMWASGFVAGVQLCREDWQPLFTDPDASAAYRPIYLLGSDETSPEEERLIARPEQREALTLQLMASAAAIYRFWFPRRDQTHERMIAETVRRNEPKVGRNDPCPCGSGKKFKKCCGADPTLH